MPKCQHQWKFMSMLTGVLVVNSSQLNPLSPPFFFFFPPPLFWGSRYPLSAGRGGASCWLPPRPRWELLPHDLG